MGIKSRLACDNYNARPPFAKAPVDLLSWVCWSLGPREMTEQIDWPGKATITSGLRLERSEVFKSLRHYYVSTQHQGHLNIDCTEEGVRRTEMVGVDDLPLKGRDKAIVSQSSLFQRQHWDHFWREKKPG